MLICKNKNHKSYATCPSFCLDSGKCLKNSDRKRIVSTCTLLRLTHVQENSSRGNKYKNVWSIN